MKYQISMEIEGENIPVGILDVYVESKKRFTTFDNEFFIFQYNNVWLEKGFSISPELPLKKDFVYESDELPMTLYDIMPDRWGEGILRKFLTKGSPLTDMELIFGVNEIFRQGALRISLLDKPDVFLGLLNNVPKISELTDLQKYCYQFEIGKITKKDLEKLLGTGTSMGGAKPKVVVKDGNDLYLAKFQSKDSLERTALWEATALDIAHIAGIHVCEHRTLNKDTKSPIFLTKRFDRDESGHRIPFASAMTLAGIPMSDAKTDYSYAELAGLIRKQIPKNLNGDLKELWKRMVFNACVGNVDDHLKNHGFLRKNNRWILSPMYDVVPFPRNADKFWPHAIGFDVGNHFPDMKEIKQIGKKAFNLTDDEIYKGFIDIGNAIKQWKEVAKKNGLKPNELKAMKFTFENNFNKEIIEIANKNKDKLSTTTKKKFVV